MAKRDGVEDPVEAAGGTRTHKGTRPGGRSARVRDAVLAAVAEELSEHSYEAFSVPRVAERAGVALTTVYRRWGSKPRLVADYASEQTQGTVPDPAGVSLREDLRTLATWVAASLDDPQVFAFLRSMLSLPEDELAEIRSRFWASRIALAQTIVDRAIARGELREGMDGWWVVEQVNAPIWMRKFVTGLPVDEAVIDNIVDRVINTARVYG